MPGFTRNIRFAAAVAVLALAGAPSLADEAGANMMATDPMKTGQMSTNAMSASPMVADPIKADCIEKAQVEADAMKKETMMAQCDAMAGGAMMKAGPMAPQQ